MKAIPFLEYFSETKLTNIDLPGQDRKVLDRIKVASQLYLLPFKPKMILEFFEGWERELPSQIDYVKPNISWDIRVIDFSCKDFKEIVIKRYPVVKSVPICFHRSFPVPRTLDEFITDCARTPVELIWKQEIVDKYFK